MNFGQISAETEHAMDMFENFLSEIGVEDAPTLLAQIQSQYTDEEIMATIAEPTTLAEMS